MTRLLQAAILALTLTAAGAAWGQASVSLGVINADPTLPLEVRAESMTVDQQTGTVVLEENVVIGQGGLRIAAGRVEVVYDEASGDIVRLHASGGVTFTSSDEAAEAQRADYDLAAQTLEMEGEVLLTQGASAISADRMSVNLATGTAELRGNVRTVLAAQPQANR